MPMGKWFVFVTFGVFAVAAIVLVGTTVQGGPDAPPAGFVVLWLGVLAWNAYWWLFRIVSELRLDGDYLWWSTPLRSGHIPLRDLVEIRPQRFATNVEVFKIRGAPSVVVLATKGLQEFTAEIAARRPDLPIRFGWQARLAERMPGWSRLKR